MTNEMKLATKQNRLNELLNRGEKNFKCPGVVRKLKRQIRNLEKIKN